MKKLLLLILLIPTFAISGPYEKHKLLLKCSGELKSNYCKKFKDKYMTRFNGCEGEPSKSMIVELTMTYFTTTKEELPKDWKKYPENKIPFYAKFNKNEAFYENFDQQGIELEMENVDKWRKERNEKKIAQGETITAWNILYDKYAREKLIDSESSPKRFMAKWEEVTLQSELEKRDGGWYAKKNGKDFLYTTKNYFEIDRIRGTLKTKTVSKKSSYFDKDDNGELIDVLLENEELRWFENEFYGDCKKVSNEQKF